MCPKYFTCKMEEGVSNNNVGAWDTLCKYCKVVLGCKEEDAAKEGHYVRVVGGAEMRRVCQWLPHTAAARTMV